MNKLKIEINNCRDCPHSQYERDRDVFICKSTGRIIKSACHIGWPPIPEFCNLLFDDE